MGNHAATEAHKPTQEKKSLLLIMDEGEKVLESIKQAMEKHFIKECRVTDLEGNLQYGILYVTEGQSVKMKKLSNQEMMGAIGKFKLSFGDLYGSVKATIKEKEPLSGKLENAVAGQGLQMKLSFTGGM